MPPEAQPETKRIKESAPTRSEQFFSALIENAADVFQLLDAEGRIKYVNPSVRRVLGYAPEELIGELVAPLLHPDELPAMQESFNQLGQQPGGITITEQRGRHKDGSWRWLQVTATNMLNDPAVQAIVVNYHDITERKKVEEALQQERDLMRALMDNLPDAIYFKDAASNFIRVNMALAHKHGLVDPKDLIGKSDFDFFVKESAQAYYEEEQEIVRTGRSIVGQEEMENWPDRAPTWGSTTKMPMHNTRGEIVGTIGLTRDITVRKEAEEALRRSERNLAAAQALAHLGSWELDLRDLDNLNANPLRWSDEVYRIFGYQPGEIESSNAVFFNAVPADERPLIEAAVAEAIQKRKQYSVDHHIVRPDGSVRFVHEESDIVYDEQTGRPSMMAGIVQDITEYQQAQADLAAKTEEVQAMTQQLWETAKLATMGELAASVAHELNNPLATIHLRVEALLDSLSADAPQRRPLEIVAQEAERMARLIANLLHFSRRGTRQISSLDVCAEIQNTLELMHYHLQHLDIAVVNECVQNLPLIPFDRQQLRQVLLNLLTNACDAMPNGGTVTLTAILEGNHIQIEVKDNGLGIAPNNLPLVTEPFFTTKPEGKGTGLGLAICRRILQDHHGRLEITSEGIAGRGTVVRLSLPLQGATMEPNSSQ